MAHFALIGELGMFHRHRTGHEHFALPKHQREYRSRQDQKSQHRRNTPFRPLSSGELKSRHERERRLDLRLRRFFYGQDKRSRRVGLRYRQQVVLNPDDIPVTKDRFLDRRTIDIGGLGLRDVSENVATLFIASNLSMIQRYGKIFEMEFVGDAATDA